MSQYDIPFDDEPWVLGALDLSIETLTGTAFEIRVSPTDTIMSIKTKIQRVEGIPVTQQHLLYNLVELDNSATVQDYAIQNGATLKLVLSMRGGPISTRRLPPADDALWREVHKWMADCREEKSERNAGRPSFLVFPDGDSVSVFKVVENDDGTYSPQVQSFTGASLENLLKKEALDKENRTMENFVTMGKMQDLKEKLEKLSITKKDKMADEDDYDVETGAEQAWFTWGPEPPEEDKPPSGPSTHDLPPIFAPPRTSDSRTPGSLHSEPFEITEKTPLRPTRSGGSLNEGASCSGASSTPTRSGGSLNEGASCSGASSTASTPLNNVRLLHREAPSNESSLSRYYAFKAKLRQARKETDNLIRLQAKSLSIVIDGQPIRNLKPTPLPDIRRSPRPERLSNDQPNEDDDRDDSSELRGKTGNRMSASSFAIVEEESDVAAGPSICSSQSSFVTMPSNDDVVVACSPFSRNPATAALGRSRYRLARYLFENTNEHKTSSPSDEANKDLFQLRTEETEDGEGKRIICSMDLRALFAQSNPETDVQIQGYPDAPKLQRDEAQYNETHSKTNCLVEGKLPDEELKLSPSRSTSLCPVQGPPAKKRPRCIVCRKRLNITNTHTCRCNGVFCSTHRYSESHDCHFDYKLQGKHLLRLANPLVTAPKLPRLN